MPEASSNSKTTDETQESDEELAQAQVKFVTFFVVVKFGMCYLNRSHVWNEKGKSYQGLPDQELMLGIQKVLCSYWKLQQFMCIYFKEKEQKGKVNWLDVGTKKTSPAVLVTKTRRK